MRARTIREVVGEARARLARISGRRLLIGRAVWVMGLGALAAASRPLLFPLGDHVPLWTGIARAAVLLVGTGLVGAVGLVWWGRRKGPAELAAARAIDGALGEHEVVASGFAFERDGRSDPESEVARLRAAEASARLDVATAFPLPSVRPRGRRAAAAVGVVIGALAIGAYDPVLLAALISPPTVDEREAAADLAADADALAAKLAETRPDPKRDRSPGRDRSKEKLGSEKSISSKAREAADAARRGDRKGALDKLDDLRSAATERASRAEGLGSALDKLADSLDAPKASSRSAGSKNPLRPSDAASESLRLLAKKTRDEGSDPGSPESQASRERMLERLERAAEELKKGGNQSGKDSAEDRAAAEQAAASMAEAKAALSRGDAEAAAKMLEQAAEHVAAMEKMRADAMAEARMVMAMLEKSGALERAIQMAMLGQKGEGQGQGKDGKGDGNGQGDGSGDGDGKGEGRPGAGGGDLRAAIAARLAVLGIGDPTGQPGEGGGHVPDRHRKQRDPLEAQGSIRAPSTVSEGERAIQAIRGLGKGSEPPTSYREVFPSYDAAAEEGLADERIPAQRRAVVRRYFETIRPGGP